MRLVLEQQYCSGNLIVVNERLMVGMSNMQLRHLADGDRPPYQNLLTERWFVSLVVYVLGPVAAAEGYTSSVPTRYINTTILRSRTLLDVVALLFPPISRALRLVIALDSRSDLPPPATVVFLEDAAADWGRRPARDE